mgnify:CR=1 FL=1
MKKIMFVMPNKGFSGAEKVVIQVINGIRDNYECYYISESGSIDSYLEENKIKHIITQNNLDRRELKKIINTIKPDIVIATDYRASVIMSTIKGNYKLISHLHNNPSWIKKLNINSIIYALVSVKFDKVFIVSESIYKEFIFRKLIEKKVHLVSNPLSRSDILNEDNKKYEKEYDIAFIGRFCEQKDPEKFIKIVKQFKVNGKPIKALMIGEGSWKNKVIDWIDYYDVNECIELRNFERNPFPYFKKSRIIVMPSKFEGFGLVAYESLCFGVPVIACPVGGLVDIIDNNCGYFCNEVDEFVDAISVLLNEEDKYNKKVEMSIKKSILLDNYSKYIENVKKCLL